VALDLKSLYERAARMEGTSNPPHWLQGGLQGQHWSAIQKVVGSGDEAFRAVTMAVLVAKETRKAKTARIISLFMGASIRDRI